MPPKKALTCSQIVRLSQVALADTCQTWEVKCSAHALDLEIRAALARRMVGDLYEAQSTTLRRKWMHED